MRKSKKETALTRRRLLDKASRLFREGGRHAVSVKDVMHEAGMTHGGFYVHFEDKESLLKEAIRHAFDGQLERLTTEDLNRLSDHVARYLSLEHVLSPGAGCPLAAFASDAGRGERSSGAALSEGVERTLCAITDAMESPPEHRRQKSIELLALLLGGVLLARMISSREAKQDVLDAIKGGDCLRAILSGGKKRRAATSPAQR